MLQFKKAKLIAVFSSLMVTAAGLGVSFPTAQAEALPQNSPQNLSTDNTNAAADEHTHAVALARDGQYTEALAILTRLHSEQPNDISVTRDLLVVSGWAGRSSDVAQLYQSLPQGNQPDYVYAAAGLAYRNLHQPQRAYDAYRLGEQVAPSNTNFLAGEIFSLTDAGQYEKAFALTATALQQHVNDPELLIAAGNANDTAAEKDPRQHNRLYQAFRYYQRAVDVAPKNREALKGLAHVTDLLGMPQVALELAQKHPGLMTDAEYRRIEGDETAMLIRWGVLEPKDEASRYAETDQAIARLDATLAQWSRQGHTTGPDVLRARFDRIVALRNRDRMQDAINDYNSLRAQGITPPTYVMSAVGDAYLYLRHPEKARNIYLKILETEPQNFEVRRQLYFAYVECNDFDNAYATIDQLDQDQSVWIRLRGLPTPLPNSYRQVADLDAGLARLYGGELSEADDRVSAITFAAPGDINDHKALGDVYATRGWPRAAAEQYELGKAQQEQGKDVGNEAGLAETALTLQEFPSAETQIDNLVQRFPENLDVQRAERSWEVENMAELLVDGYYDARPSNSPNGGEGFGVGSMIYSAPFDYNYRLFAGSSFAQEKEPLNEGSVGYWRNLVGLEYRNGPLTLEGAPTFNIFHDETRAGGYVDGNYSFDDQWSTKLAGELFSRNTPLRALNKGITADEADAGITWRQSESREVTVSGGVMPFSDGNFRSLENVAYQQRLFTAPEWKIDGLANGDFSQNSKNENRPYYNPSNDFLGEVGARVTETLYQRYNLLYEHSLEFTPGIYLENHYKDSFAYNVRYEQTLHTSDTFEVGWGIGMAGQTYDGTYENDLNVTVNLIKRF